MRDKIKQIMKKACCEEKCKDCDNVYWCAMRREPSKEMLIELFADALVDADVVINDEPEENIFCKYQDWGMDGCDCKNNAVRGWCCEYRWEPQECKYFERRE